MSAIETLGSLIESSDDELIPNPDDDGTIR